MKLPSYFDDFLAEIRLTKEQVKDLKTGHRTLRDRLEGYPDLAPILVSTFLQGSYRRSTAVRPKGGQRADVDVIIVTTLDSNAVTPDEAMQKFVPFFEKYYEGKYKLQGRSICIELSYVDLDAVITAAPSEAVREILKAKSVTTEDDLFEAPDWRLVKSWVAPEERVGGLIKLMEASKNEPEWKTEPLLIPDRDARIWQRTDPLRQIQWTRDKNRKTDGNYINVVKALKWWRRVSATGEQPKGYPVEHLIGVCCPDGVATVADGVTATLETIVSTYGTYAATKTVPFLQDHGVPEHNVFKRVTGDEFAVLFNKVKDASRIARQALDSTDVEESATLWRRLFGDKFPSPPEREDAEKGGGFTPRTAPSVIGGGRYA